MNIELFIVAPVPFVLIQLLVPIHPAPFSISSLSPSQPPLLLYHSCTLASSWILNWTVLILPLLTLQIWLERCTSGMLLRDGVEIEDRLAIRIHLFVGEYVMGLMIYLCWKDIY